MNEREKAASRQPPRTAPYYLLIYFLAALCWTLSDSGYTTRALNY